MQRQTLGARIAALVFGQRPPPAPDPFVVFHEYNAKAINHARQSHLASLGLDLKGKKVLEVGVGIGLHTPFFLERGCDVTVTDGRPRERHRNQAPPTRREDGPGRSRA